MYYKFNFLNIFFLLFLNIFFCYFVYFVILINLNFCFLWKFILFWYNFFKFFGFFDSLNKLENFVKNIMFLFVVLINFEILCFIIVFWIFIGLKVNFFCSFLCCFCKRWIFLILKLIILLKIFLNFLLKGKMGIFLLFFFFLIKIGVNVLKVIFELNFFGFFIKYVCLSVIL